jgi:hypothetical protein
VFFASSARHYLGEIDAPSRGLRAVSGFLLLGAAVIAYRAGRQEAQVVQKG